MSYPSDKPGKLRLDAYECASLLWLARAVHRTDDHKGALAMAIALTAKCLELRDRGCPPRVLERTFDHSTLREIPTPRDIRREIDSRAADGSRYNMDWQPGPALKVALHDICRRADLETPDQAIRFSLQYCETLGKALSTSGRGRTTLVFGRDFDSLAYEVATPFDRSLRGIFTRSVNSLSSLFAPASPSPAKRATTDDFPPPPLF